MPWVLKTLVSLAGIIGLLKGFQWLFGAGGMHDPSVVPDRLARLIELSPLPQISVFATVALAVAVATAGGGFRFLNFAYLAGVGLTAFMWPRTLNDALHSGPASALFVFVIIVGLPVFVVFNAHTFLRGFYYLFVPHPAARVVTPSLDQGTRINTRSLGQALRKAAADTGARSATYYKTQTEKAHALKEKLDADAGIAEATVRRERARAALHDAEHEVREAEKRARDT